MSNLNLSNFRYEIGVNLCYVNKKTKNPHCVRNYTHENYYKN